VEAVETNGRVACLRRKGCAIAWLRLPDDAALTAFVARASPLIEKPSGDLIKEQKRRCADSKKKHVGKSKKAKKLKALPCNKFEACLQHWAFPLLSLEAFAKENGYAKHTSLVRKICTMEKIVEEDESTDEGESGSDDSPRSFPETSTMGRSFFAILRNDEGSDSLGFSELWDNSVQLQLQLPDKCNAHDSWNAESDILDYQLF
jgi:hypothetical protein